MKKTSMIRTQISLTPKQHQFLTDKSKNGISMSDMIRRAVDKYIEEEKEKER